MKKPSGNKKKDRLAAKIPRVPPTFDKIPRYFVLNSPLREVRFRVPTPDDWYPCHPGGTVEVSLHEDGGGVWRIAIWGDDDDGRERNFDSEAAMRDAAAKLPVPVTKAWLKQNGFVRR